MTTHTHNCAATGCQKQVPVNLLMCMTHWKMVHEPIKRTVLATHRARQRRGSDAIAHDQHMQACAAAVEAVHAKQHRKIAEKTVRDGALFGI